MSGAELTSPEQIQQLAVAFQRSRVLLSAFELGLFDVVDRAGAGGLASAAAAQAIGADPRATDRLLGALCALGLMVKTDGRFRNGPLAEAHLVSGRPGFMGGLGHVASLWETWSTLTAAVRAGTSVRQRPAGPQAEARQKAFILAMHHRGRAEAADLVARLDLRGVRRVLDVGGGSGVFAMALVAACPGSRAVILDLPETLALTKGYLAAAGMADRIDLQEGDFLAADFGTGFDLVLLSAVLHINSPAENLGLLQKSHAALNAGGQAVIREFILEEDRTGPPFAALFALNMLVGTKAGDAYTYSEMAGWLTEAGFVEVRRLDDASGSGLMVGFKR
jgi:predicted O-methyltransferase YrrM